MDSISTLRAITGTCAPIMPLRGLGSPPPGSLAGTFAIRTDGLLGDNIVASTAFTHLFDMERGRYAILYSTYRHDPKRLSLLGDLFRELVEAGLIRAILFEGREHGPLTETEIGALRRLGSEPVYDCGPWEKQFTGFPRTEPFLGRALRAAWQEEPVTARKVAVLRWSGFHPHYSLRNRPWAEWEIIQTAIHQAGYVPVIFGWHDDPHPSGNGVLDLRGTLSVYGTLQRMARCAALVSTVTFAPLFVQHYRHCFVVSDPTDMENLRQRWKVSENYHLFDAATEYVPVLCAELAAKLPR